MKKLKLKLLAMKIEWHWLFIKLYRRKINDLLEKGIKLTNPKLLGVYDVLNKHCTRVMVAQKRYEDLCGITEMLYRVQALHEETVA